MRNDITFMVLGGGQSVGASCYFLKLGDNNILLDCGIGFSEGVPFAPNIYGLLESGLVESPNQIGQVYISHAHSDHTGYIHEYATQFKNPIFYMTNLTKMFTEFQIKKTSQELLKYKKLIDADNLMAQRVSCVSYQQEIPFRNYKVSFYEAGHIPGAMMTLFQYNNRNILYTGDYSLNPTPWTNGCQLPKKNIDILIMCGLHARHPDYTKSGNGLDKIIQRMYASLRYKKSVYCRIGQLSKGIEIIRRLKISRCSEYKIFIDKYINNLVNAMENLGIPILNEKISPFTSKKNFPHILIGTSQYAPDSSYTIIKDNFALHDDFDETIEFVKRVNPKLAVVVHSPPANFGENITIEQPLLKDADCRTQCIFAETNEIYNL